VFGDCCPSFMETVEAVIEKTWDGQPLSPDATVRPPTRAWP
jgi:hypothetical protein